MPRARVCFPAWGVTFYQDLESNNTKEFWTEHKAEWERQVRDPMRALVAELKPQFGPATIFRPRFIMGHSRTGVTNSSDFACRMIKS